MMFIRRALERITRPSPQLKPRDVRQQARSLSALTLALLVSIVVVAPIWIGTSPGFVYAPFIVGTQVAAFCVAYAFSRTQWYRFGAGVLVISLTWLVVANLVLAPGVPTERMLVLNFLIFPIILSRYFLKLHFRLALTAIASLVIAIFFMVPEVPFVHTYSYLIFFALLVAFGGIDTVINAQFRAHAAQSEARYLALFQQSHDAVFILDLAGNHLDANHRATEMLGYTRAEFLRLTYRELSAQVDASTETLNRLLNGERFQGYERLFRRKDDSLIPVEINVELVRDLNGVPLHIQSVVRDISERKRTETALRESEARQRALLNAIPDLMFVMDKAGVYLDYHAANPAELAAPPEVFMGRSMVEVLPPDIAAPILERFERLIATRQEQTFECTLPLRDQKIDYEFRLVMCGDDEVLSLVRNVSERRQSAQRAFELQLEKERTRLIAQFIQNASHELRTPLSIISTGLSLLARADDPVRRAELKQRGEEQISRMAELLDIMLSMSQLDSGIPFRQDSVNLNIVITDIRNYFEKSCEKKSLNLQVTLDPALPNIIGDEQWLNEAMQQVVANAVRYTPDRGNIWVTSCQHANAIVIEVRDNGIGISEDALPRIMERFWRQDEAHSTPGFGLGLPIVKTILERHGGRLEVESTLGVGSTFRMKLPMQQGAPVGPTT